uniref:Putative secreted peptide n=1 Tax=Anopheles braziliensis TaxID=58242 RepID=A0A2M3ZW64_9DIPT
MRSIESRNNHPRVVILLLCSLREVLATQKQGAGLRATMLLASRYCSTTVLVYSSAGKDVFVVRELAGASTSDVA